MLTQQLKTFRKAEVRNLTLWIMRKGRVALWKS